MENCAYLRKNPGYAPVTVESINSSIVKFTYAESKFCLTRKDGEVEQNTGT